MVIIVSKILGGIRPNIKIELLPAYSNPPILAETPSLQKGLLSVWASPYVLKHRYNLILYNRKNINGKQKYQSQSYPQVHFI
jgi:hypothetical protein